MTWPCSVLLCAQDFPDRLDDKWMKHTLCWSDPELPKGGQSRRNIKIDYRPVHMQPLDKEMEHVPPKARVY